MTVFVQYLNKNGAGRFPLYPGLVFSSLERFNLSRQIIKEPESANKCQARIQKKIPGGGGVSEPRTLKFNK